MGSFPHPEETAERENKTGKEEKPEEEKRQPQIPSYQFSFVKRACDSLTTLGGKLAHPPAQAAGYAQ